MNFSRSDVAFLWLLCFVKWLRIECRLGLQPLAQSTLERGAETVLNRKAIAILLLGLLAVFDTIVRTCSIVAYVNVIHLRVGKKGLELSFAQFVFQERDG